MIQRTDDGRGHSRPDLSGAPRAYVGELEDLFDTWDSVRPRNARLSRYYRMKNALVNLGVAVPPQFECLNAVVGWADKAVRVMSVRSQFDGFVSNGAPRTDLNALSRENGLDVLYDSTCRAALVHGVAAMTVMAGRGVQPAAKVRSLSANQCCMLWDKDRDTIGCGVMLADVDRDGQPLRYVAHFPDKVLEASRPSVDADWEWAEEPNPLGIPLMVPFVYDPDDDKPLGQSRITPEVTGIIDKAMRDVLRMEVGAEFFTAPQRYILGADDSLFRQSDARKEFDADGSAGDARKEFDADGSAGDARSMAESDDSAPGKERAPIDRGKMMRAYMGRFLAITRDANGDVPQVGQFPAGDAENFIRVFENDAQRFSGATNVPLGQLGVLSNTYTSSDALGAANDPLILDVEAMNRRHKRSLELVGRLMLAVAYGTSLADVDSSGEVIAHMVDPSMPTFSARADGWTKIGQQDQGVVGTRVWYEGMGLPQETIDRIMAEKGTRSSIQVLDELTRELSSGGGRQDGGQGAV
ncbi:MAG: phage portal protein [Atopobiaceae bacterium]